MANEWQDPQQQWPRPQPSPPGAAATPQPLPTYSADGQWVWDGQQWRPAAPGVADPYGPQPWPQRSVSKTRRSTSHTFHLIMTILTAGLWGLCVWLPVTLWHKWGPRRRTVTRSR